MKSYVYVDVLFLVNLVVNYIILLAAGKLAGQTPAPKRILVAAFFGSVYAVSAMIIPLQSFFSLPARLLFGLFMVAVSYPGAKGVAFISLAASFYFCSAITAGTAMALLNSKAASMLKDTILEANYPVVHWWVVAFSLIVVSSFPFISHFAGYRPPKPLPLVRMELVVDGHSIPLTALVDTGNNLRDPVSDLPVIVVDWDCLREVMPREVAPFFLSAWDSVSAELGETTIGRRLRLIPYSNVSGQKGVLPGFKPDCLVLWEKGGDRVCKDAVVGVSEAKISPSGLYQALLHPDLVNF